MPRFAETATQVKTNFTLGHDCNPFSSTYDKDFNPHAIRNTRLLNFYNDYKFSHKPLSSPKESASTDFLVTRSKKNPKVQKTYITFGNEVKPNRVTAYDEFTSHLHDTPREKPVPHPVEAEILPPCLKSPLLRSCVHDDFTFFGNDLNRNVYGSRVGDLNSIKNINTRDSVGVALLGRRRKMLTRSMIDYKHPLERVKGNIKDFMIQQISPSVRQDSVWQSVNTGRKDYRFSENKGNFSWPHAEKGMKRFYRGQMNKER